MKKNIFKKLLGVFSVSTALFVFQACYGTPQDFKNDVLIQGVVKSSNSNLPIQGIKVKDLNTNQYEYTDENGYFTFYTERMDTLKFMFEDTDSTQNGRFSSKDTTVTDIKDTIELNVQLEEL